jgi:hypothetical protein
LKNASVTDDYQVMTTTAGTPSPGSGLDSQQKFEDLDNSDDYISTEVNPN